MPRPRVNPFDPGTAERVLFDRYRKATAAADAAERDAALSATEGRSHRAAAAKYAEALASLGHGDKLPDTVQRKLPDYTAIGPHAD